MTMTDKEITDELSDALVDAAGEWVPARNRFTGTHVDMVIAARFIGEPIYKIRYELRGEMKYMNLYGVEGYRLADRALLVAPALSTTVDKYLIVREDEGGPVICTRITTKPEDHDHILREEIERLAHKYPGHRISAYADMPMHTARANLMWGGQ